jgi:hypothetical protein
MLASFTKSPELELSVSEAETLARGIAEVNRHYPVPINPGYVAIGTLCAAAFAIYRGKFVAIARRKAVEKRAMANNGEAETGASAGFVVSPLVQPIAAPWFNLGGETIAN